MNVETRNRLLLSGEVDRDDLWPKVTEYEGRRFQFRWEFGLEKLPESPGLITIRGPRQSGKSTWLELQLLGTIEDFGAGTAFFLNGDYIYSHQEFEEKLLEIERLYRKGAKVRRLFIDEITQIPDWQRVIKRLIDSGHLRNMLIVTTGSNAADLLRGAERLPGRKGSGFSKTEYLFLPISFKEFWYQVRDELGTFRNDVFWAYLLSGGSPLAVESIYRDERLDDSFVSLISDWVLGDIAQSGRSRVFALNVFRKLHEFAPNPVSYTRLAREAGLANNTAALDYIQRLSDLLCVSPMMMWDSSRNTTLARKASKFPFINLAVAWVFHPQAPRYLHELKGLEGQARGALYEWAVAQELWRRSQLDAQKRKAFSASPTDLMYWASKDHEIDFITPAGEMFEVKAGASSALEFAWFGRVFPKKRLQVISETPFETDHIRSRTLKSFYLEAESELYFDSDRAPWEFEKNSD